MTPVRRPRRARLAVALVLAAWPLFLAAGALAQPRGGPVVDIVEVSGILDRPIARYVEEQLAGAERRGSSLLLLHIDSAGAVKTSDARSPVLPLARRIAGARVPVAVFVGPRSARLAGGALAVAQAADVVAATPQSRIGPLHPVDFAAPGRWTPRAEGEAVASLAGDSGRALGARVTTAAVAASEALDGRTVDLVVPGAADLLRGIHGKAVETAAGPVTLDLPERGTDVRFHKPGPLRRALHTLANPALVMILMLTAAMMIVFELFQPGFGVSGVTGAALMVAGGYGFTVLPVRAWAVALAVVGLVLLTADIALHELSLLSWAGLAALGAGSALMFPGAAGELRIPLWLVALALLGAFIFFVPVMTVVRRSRHEASERASRRLVGETGEVRSILNPEGFVWVSDTLWRARAEEGQRVRVGETIVVVAIDGATLRVRRAGQTA